MKMICNICCEDNELCTMCKCPSIQCQFEACLECYKKYIIANLQEPRCMSCKMVFSREYIMEIMEKHWNKHEFLPHMASLLLEQENMLLPGTQAEANTVMKLRILSKRRALLPTNKSIERLYKKNQKEIDGKKTVLKEEKLKIELSMKELRISPSLSSRVRSLPVYIMKCPYDSCRGFVTSEHKCETCDSDICCHCRSTIDKSQKHKCKKEDIENCNDIANNTKPCPKCFVPIFKNGGCSQIWCPQCHTAFDYTTGKIDDGPIHNALYFDWLASRPTDASCMIEIDVIACGEVPNEHQFVRLVRHMDSIQSRTVLEILRYKTHIEYVILPQCGADRIKDNIDLRIQFLVGDIDKQQWHSKLLFRQNKKMKLSAIHELFTLMRAVICDVLRKIYVSPGDVGQFIQEYDTLLIFQDEGMDRICEIHGGSWPRYI